MDHDARGSNNNEHDEDHRDAMEVDGTLDVAPSDRSGREPPAFDENTERPRQRRRYHVTVEDDEIRDGTGDNVADDEVAVLETHPPRMSDLSIETPQSTTPPGEPVTMRDPEPASPRINTIPLPDVPPPQPQLNPVMEAARRLTTAPDANSDQMQADLALLAPYIAAQAMAAAFPAAGRPPGGATPGNGPPQPNAPEGQAQGGTNNNNNNGPPPLPPFFFGLPPFMFGGNSEPPADPKRAERLAGGLHVVEDGLLKRWKAVCGDQGAVCAVCYGELLEEPGIDKEIEKEEDKEDKVPQPEEPKQDMATDEHERNLLEALKRREEMEKLEEQERALKLETAVLAFPCGHVFHRTCLLPWLSRHTTCPTCRFDIDPKSDTLVLPAEEDLPPFMGGPGGLNFGDYFTVGPVLRVPRSHIPGFGPRRRPTGEGLPTGENTQPAGGEGNPPTGDAGNPPSSGNATPGQGLPHAPSVAEMFDMLLGSVLAAAAGGPPRPPRERQEGANSGPQTNPGQEQQGTNPEQTTTAPAPLEVPLPESPAETPGHATPIEPPVSAPPAPQTTQPEASSSTAPPPTTATPSTSTPSAPSGRPEIVARTLDYDRPMAMFGRPSPRRPPQSITPIWMRPPRPANAPALRTVPNDPAPSPRAVSSPVTPSASAPTQARSAPGSSTPRSASNPRPTSTSTSGLGQLRAIVSNLIPRRLSSSRTSNAPSVRSNASTESVARGVTSPTSHGVSSPISRGVTSPTSRSVTSPIFSPREGGLRAMLHGPAALLRDLTAPSSRRTNTDDIPALETDSETFSEDDAQQTDEESEPDDLPALEPIDPRTRGGRRPSPEPEHAPVPEPQQEPAPTQPAPSRPDHPVDNIITLRIDLGHADGRDETIIVPLLFNPLGRGDQNRPNNNDANPPAEPARPASEPRRPRTPPPLKKWNPPEPIKTFRQVVEEREREAGWRCDDPACLLGPADDEEPSEEPTIKPMYSIMRSIGPEPVRYKIEDGIRVYADGEDVRVKGENPVCSHKLHPECLVTSARVNGWGPEHNNDSNSKRVTLRCPMCRLEGTVERQVWDAGVQAEE
ncbi:unnamed protein product [Rhizoctonia solani]|uniref:RING-type domain-containing protein n=1 Tax=Rhizoctonia solani TaxID=456999 RepID=A0A8H3C0B3_9AGAM|nr:unnamed protein product [Rhizoctonia solani]